ncbi:cysteine rich repeat-containing protein [Rhodoplanes sp. SY1]|uniref:cysteine rich repeat-containing protein n=1 Tax=Rhodoplanes sp. SY1 TaxID=3166646 RepID=UPI0038B4B044
MRSILAVTGFAVLLAAGAQTSALAQDQAVLRDACKADYQKLCQGVQPGGGRIIKCLQDQSDKLSPGCKTALSSRK